MMYLCYPPALRDIFHTPMARFSLFVLKVPLNTKQLTKLFVYSVYVGRTADWDDDCSPRSVIFVMAF